MEPQKINITIVKNNTRTDIYTIKENGVAKDLTGYILKMTAVDGNGIEVFDRQATIDDPTSGVAKIELTTTDTGIPAGKYRYDITWFNANDTDIKSPIYGVLYIREKYSNYGVKKE